MRHQYAIVSIAIAAAISAPSRAQDNGATYRVTQQGGGLGIWIDETVAFTLSAEHPRWVAERTRRDGNWCGRTEPGKGCVSTVISTHEWIDGALCPELLRSLQALAAVHVEGFVDPMHMDLTTVSDTPLLEVTGPSPNAAGFGASLKVSAYSGPFVDWWSQSEARLKGCWSPRAINFR
jgi:hypothetical protein